MTRFTRFFSITVTVFLLAVLAHQCARVFWRVTAPAPTIKAPEISVASPSLPAWLSQLNLSSAKATIHGKYPKNALSSTANNISQAWRLKGVYAEAGDSIAIIQTDNASRVVEVGDIVEKGYIVTAITSNQVTLANDSDPVVLNLSSRHLDALAENTFGHQLPPSDPAIAPPLTAKVPGVAFKESAWLQHLLIKPRLENGQPAFEVAADNATGEGLLQGVGLQSGDIILSVDGQAPTPQAWRALATKLRQSQKIRAKIKRRGTIQTITIQQ